MGGGRERNAWFCPLPLFKYVRLYVRGLVKFPTIISAKFAVSIMQSCSASSLVTTGDMPIITSLCGFCLEGRISPDT